MDNSITYIKMSEMLDFEWNPQIGDFCSYDGKTVEIITNIVDEIHDISCNYWTIIVDTNKRKRIDSEELIPLFRQDQLQNMIPGLPLNHVLRISRFVDLQDDGSGKILEWDSMEQLWLAFIMQEKDKKTWNGEDWIKN